VFPAKDSPIIHSQIGGVNQLVISELPQNEVLENALRKLVKLMQNDNLWRTTAAWQNWRLPPCRLNAAV
jgi:hypothetical protein